MLVSFNDYGKKPPVFEDASAVANAILESGFEFDTGALIYNKFKTVVAYETTEIPLHTLETILGASKIHVYDSLDAEVSTSRRSSDPVAFAPRNINFHKLTLMSDYDLFRRHCAVIMSSIWLRPSTTP